MVRKKICRRRRNIDNVSTAEIKEIIKIVSTHGNRVSLRKVGIDDMFYHVLDITGIVYSFMMRDLIQLDFCKNISFHGNDNRVVMMF